MKAILIDPFTKTVTDVVLPDGTIETMRKTLQCAYVECVRYFGNNEVGCINDEGMLVDWDRQAFFKLSNSATIAGRMVLARETQTGWTDTRFDAALIRPHVTFVDAKDVRVPAMCITTLNKDGTESERNYFGGPSEWTYEQQPTKKGS